MLQDFNSVKNLLGEVQFNQLSKAHIAVLGLGGVGSWAAEALVRSGLGQISLMDLDDSCVSNITRQIQALHSTVGQQKTQALSNRCLDINPNLKVNLINEFYTQKTRNLLWEYKPDVVIDAVDGSINKADIIIEAAKYNIPVICCGGAAGRSDPTQIRIGSLWQVHGDPLLRSVKKNLRSNNPEWQLRDITVVYNKEKIEANVIKGRLTCNTSAGAMVTATAAMGLAAAHAGILSLFKAHSLQK